MSIRCRHIFAAFRSAAGLRKAMRELEAIGIPPACVTRAKGAAAMRHVRALSGAEESADGASALTRALTEGATLVAVRACDNRAEKRISMTLLRHSDGPVQLLDEAEPPCGRRWGGAEDRRSSD